MLIVCYILTNGAWISRRTFEVTFALCVEITLLEKWLFNMTNPVSSASTSAFINIACGRIRIVRMCVIAVRLHFVLRIGRTSLRKTTAPFTRTGEIVAFRERSNWRYTHMVISASVIRLEPRIVGTLPWVAGTTGTRQHLTKTIFNEQTWRNSDRFEHIFRVRQGRGNFLFKLDFSSGAFRGR